MRIEPIAPEDLTAEQRPLRFLAQGWRARRAFYGDAGVSAIRGFTVAHEVAILVTGARFNSRYEVYAHEAVADEPPPDLTREEAIAYDVASVAIEAFGADGVAELTFPCRSATRPCRNRPQAFAASHSRRKIA